LSLPRSDADPGTTGFVLAGGLSSRMGADKALVRLGGRPLVSWALETLRTAGLAVSIAGARSPLAEFAPVVEDTGQGPLSGVCAALQSCPAGLAVFLSVDLPLMPASLIEYLVQHARVTGAVVTVPAVNGFAQTFPAVVDRAALPMLQRALQAGRGGCFAAFQLAAERLGRGFSIVPVELVAQPGQVAHPAGLAPAFWFLNVNGPGDLQRAETLVASRIA